MSATRELIPSFERKLSRNYCGNYEFARRLEGNEVEEVCLKKIHKSLLALNITKSSA